MRSSSGIHYLALDHVRAVAALMVFVWHFLHSVSGTPVPFSQAPLLLPLALLDEGHVGVALFMTLSGYLFARLLDGKQIVYSRFLFNRLLRLLPLLFFVLVVRLVLVWVHEGATAAVTFVASIPGGLIFPSLPNGGWSITVELHFYLVLPVLLALNRKSGWNGLLLVAAAILLRAWIFQHYGSVQNAAYFTIIGRIDQFVLGILACRLPFHAAAWRRLAVVATVGLVGFYWYFDYRGGFMRWPGYPSDNPVWVVMSTIEGVCLATLIRWYDSCCICGNGVLSRWVGRVGEYSYSIYLLHMFVVFDVAQYIHRNIMDISNFYIAMAWGFLSFVVFLPFAGLSFYLVELPFMHWRKRYVVG